MIHDSDVMMFLQSLADVEVEGVDMLDGSSTSMPSRDDDGDDLSNSYGSTVDVSFKSEALRM